MYTHYWTTKQSTLTTQPLKQCTLTTEPLKQCTCVAPHLWRSLYTICWGVFGSISSSLPVFCVEGRRWAFRFRVYTWRSISLENASDGSLILEWCCGLSRLFFQTWECWCCGLSRLFFRHENADVAVSPDYFSDMRMLMLRSLQTIFSDMRMLMLRSLQTIFSDMRMLMLRSLKTIFSDMRMLMLRSLQTIFLDMRMLLLLWLEQF